MLARASAQIRARRNSYCELGFLCRPGVIAQKSHEHGEKAVCDGDGVWCTEGNCTAESVAGALQSLIGISKHPQYE